VPAVCSCGGSGSRKGEYKGTHDAYWSRERNEEGKPPRIEPLESVRKERTGKGGLLDAATLKVVDTKNDTPGKGENKKANVVTTSKASPRRSKILKKADEGQKEEGEKKLARLL